jgi:putative tryptophan/tyrosine transport system substrate-binding protein
MRRREFIALIGGAASWPLAVSAQQAERKRQIGVLINFRPDDPEGQARVTAFGQALQGLGWIEGDNVRTDTRWAGDDAELYHGYAEELVALAPDVILAGSSPSVAARCNGLLAVCRLSLRGPSRGGVYHQLGAPRGQ